jgi:hypothetical protein
MAMKKKGTHKIEVEGSDVVVYGGVMLKKAYDALADNMNTYQWAKFTMLLEAAYKKGSIDGANEAFEQIDKGVRQALKAVPHKLPGRYKKK